MIRLVVGLAAQAPLSREQKIAKGQRVALLLADDFFGQVLAEAADDLVEQWSKETSSAMKREELWAQLQGLQSFTKYLQRLVDQGRVAATQG